MSTSLFSMELGVDAVLPFFAALLLSAALVPVCRAVAFRLGIIVQPKEDRFHSRAIGLFGGVAIAVSLFISSILFDVAEPVLIICSAALLVVGMAHDVVTLKPYVRLVAQIVLASVFLFYDYRLHWTVSITLDSILTVFWIVGITSAFNLLDNMDGLCGGIALIAGTAFLFTLLPAEPAGPRFVAAQYLSILLGAIAGFLVYNIHPASVAMGASGSLLIGLNLAAVPLRVAPGIGSDLLSVIAVPALVLLIPIADATLVTVSRLVSGRLGGVDRRDEASHRLVAIGLSERAAVGLLWTLAAVGGLIGVSAGRGIGLTGLMAATFILAIAIFAVYLARVRVYEGAESAAPGSKITPLIVDFVARRRIVEVILDLCLVSVAYYGAYRLRFEGMQYAPNYVYFLQSFPVVLGTQMVALFVVGSYRGTWKYFGLADGVTFAQGVFLGAVTAQALILYLYDFEGYSQGVFVVYGMLLVLMLVGSRASFRLISEFAQRQRQGGRRLVIYGAGDSGALAARHVLNDPGTAYRILGFVDDDADKRNVRVQGYRILGVYDDLVDMIMGGVVDAVVVTHRALSTQGLERLCARYGVALYRMRFDWLEVAGEPGHAAMVPAEQGSDGSAPVPVARPPVVRHAFSVDVEDWFHGIPVDTAMKDAAPPRLERGLHVLLDLLAERRARATFFILGPLVAQYPNVVRRIAEDGHELGCHGWSHDLVYEMTRERFAEETRRSRDAIADLTGKPVEGFRAAYFSITRESLWALDVLAQLGFKYDSSVFPVRNWRYGIEGFSREPVLIDTPSGSIWEFPISVMDRYGQTIPVSGGAYFRLYPYSLTRANFRAQEREGRNVIFYLHPWELDPDHPQVSFAWRPRFTHYANLQTTRPKLVRLLRDFNFGSIGDVIAAKV